MKGDKGFDSGPHPVSGQGWGSPPEAPGAADGNAGAPPGPGELPADLGQLPPAPDGVPPGAGAAPQGGADLPRSEKLKVWLYFSPFLAAMILVPLGVVGFQKYQDGKDDPSPVVEAAPSPSPEPEPEPVSTVPPVVKGWKAVTSAKYEFTYDVPKDWELLPPTTLAIWEQKDGSSTGLSSAARWGDGLCTDRAGNEYILATAGLQQYVDGGEPQEVAKHAASKFAKLGYTPVQGGPAPAVKVGRPEAVRAGKAKAVHVRAAVAVRGKNECLAPRAVVHVVALPGTAPGHTTVFVMMSARGVPEAAPDRQVTKVIGSLRPN